VRRYRTVEAEMPFPGEWRPPISKKG
jgi:hypothetical protein